MIINVEFFVDKDVINKDNEDNLTTEELIERELNWLNNSGIHQREIKIIKKYGLFLSNNSNLNIREILNTYITKEEALQGLIAKASEIIWDFESFTESDIEEIQKEECCRFGANKLFIEEM